MLITWTLRQHLTYFTAAFNNMDVDSKIQSLTNKCAFRYRQSNVRRLLPASDYTSKRAVIKSLGTISDNETVLGSSRKLGGAAEHPIDGSEKRICRLSFEF